MQKATMIVCLTSLFLVGCSASGPAFKPQELKNEQAVIYIYRPGNSYVGSAVALAIECNGDDLGYLKPNGYLYRIVHAGECRIASETETKAEIPFEAQRGKSYYIEAQVEMGLFIGRPKLIMVPEEHGRLAILGTHYSGSSPPVAQEAP